MDIVNVEQDSDGLVVVPANDSREARAAWGTTRALIQNMVTGVSAGFEKKLAIQGVGYRAALQGKDVKLSLGFSHEVVYAAPQGITLAVPAPTEIVVTGIDKQQVGQVAAEIRGWRPPEPYKGKGVRYAGEQVFRKEGKKK
jgi:large subunit ribosomal protein L6